MSRARGRVELAEYAAMARRAVRAFGDRFAAEGDEPELRDLFELHAEIDDALTVAVTHMRARGEISWKRIGEAVGISAEQARYLWGTAPDGRSVKEQRAEKRATKKEQAA